MDHLLSSVSSLSTLQWTSVFLAFIILLWPRKSAARKYNLPPSPRGLPVIGHLHLLGSYPHSSLRRLSQRHGSLVFLHLGSVPMLVVSSPGMAREVLQTQDIAFASRPLRVAADYFFYKSRDIAFSPNNLYWKNVRKLCATELFTVRRLASFTGIVRDEVWELCSELLKAYRDNKQVVNLRSSLSAYAFNITTRILMRKSYFGPKAKDYSPKEAAEFVEFMKEVPKAAGTFCIGDAFPSLAWFNPDVLAWKDIRRRMDAFLDKILLQHKVREGPEDFMDLLIKHFGWNAATDIKAVTLDLLTAGTDTSTATIEWALAALLHKPELFERAQKELHDVVGPGRMVEESDLPQLEFMNAVVKETFRLYPPVPLLLPRVTDRPVTVGGYDIPERTTVVVNTYAIGRDETVWEKAEDFNPERFIGGSSVDVYGLDFELLPFGSGRRRCPGLMLGMKAVHMGLCNVVHGFEWKFPEGVTGENHEMVGTAGVVHFLEKPLQAHATPRLPLNIYESLKMQE